MNPSPPQIFAKPITVAVVGPHYAGKSLLCSMFQSQLGFASFKEEWWKDPFKDLKPKDYFRSQLWFLTQRLGALKQAKDLNASGTSVVLDTFYFSTLIFGETKLSSEEHQVFVDLVSLTSEHLPLPDIVIYLYAEPKFLFSVRREQRIKAETGPKSDATTPFAWYSQICALNQKCFADWKRTPLITVDVQKVDFVGDSQAFDNLVTTMRERLK